MKKKTHNKIIHVSDTHVIIQLHTNNTLNVPIDELTFHPRVNGIVEVYQNQNHVVICPLPPSNKLWILITSIALLILIIIGTTFFFFRHPNKNIETVDSQSSQQISSTTSSSSASSSSSSSTSTTSSTENNIIDTTAENLRDMENDGTLKTGQLYRFTAELFHQKDWADYYGHFSYLNKYYNIKVKASNASIAGIEIHINKNLTDGWKEGQLVTFTVKIVEDSEKFQYWIVTEATPYTEPSTQKEESVSEPQEIDAQAILDGDFSTVAGTWRNENGQEFKFNKNGLVSNGDIEKVSIGNDGSINFSIRSGTTGYGMSIYPIGQAIKWVDSDLSKNRLIAGQGIPTTNKSVFYKRD